MFLESSLKKSEEGKIQRKEIQNIKNLIYEKIFKKELRLMLTV